MNTEENKKMCVTEVRESGRWPHYHPCGRKSIGVDLDGKPCCKIHSPAFIAAKEKKREKKWEAEAAKENFRWSALRACQGMKNPEEEVAALKAVAEAGMQIGATGGKEWDHFLDCLKNLFDVRR